MGVNIVLVRFCLFSTFLIVIEANAQRGVSMPQPSLVDSLKSEYHVPIVGISTIQNGKLYDAQMFGNLPHHSPAPKNTFFNIASLTKPLTSTTVLILVSRKEWDLDEPLSKYWTDPDVATDDRSKRLTSRHILSHQSGLPNWRGHEKDGKLAFAFEPGTQWKYSGEGFEYLRKALEAKFKTPIERIVDSILFTPLKMTETRFFWTSSTDSNMYANRYHEDGTPFPVETWYEANPSNLVLTTVEDYAKFGVGIIKEFGLSKNVYKQMITNQAQLPGGKEWGLGWRLIKHLKNGEYALVHTGGNPGISTIIILLPQSKRGIVIFTNGANGAKVYEQLVTHALDVGKEIVERMK